MIYDYFRVTGQNPANNPLHTDKAVDVSVVIQEQVSQIQNYAQKELEKETQEVDLGWTSDTANVHSDAL